MERHEASPDGVLRDPPLNAGCGGFGWRDKGDRHVSPRANPRSPDRLLAGGRYGTQNKLAEKPPSTGMAAPVT
jgi:hypothetical protein